MATIGKRIFDRRVELGMSQDELAQKVGYKDRSSIAKIESGERDIRQRKVILFAEALKTTPQWLMGYDDAEKNAPHVNVRSMKEAELMKLLTENGWYEYLSELTPENRSRLKDIAEAFLSAQAQADQATK